jgi:hypothetical protein
MLKKLKNNLKNLSNKGKENSILDFVLEISENYKIKNAEFNSLKDKRKFNREKERGLLKMEEVKINGRGLRESSQRQSKIFLEDKENDKPKLGRNVLKPSQSENNLSIKNYFKPNGENLNTLSIQIKGKPLKSLPKIKKIEFYDEMNKKNVKMNQFEEKELGFQESKKMPAVKWMKIDNDVMTDSEQLNDALKMMRDNLKETIKLIQSDKDYLNKNLSKKIKFVSSKGR